MKPYSRNWFAVRLQNFLHDRHPRLEDDKKLIDHRTALALARFEQAREKG